MNGVCNQLVSTHPVATPKVAVLIVTYNFERWLNRCMGSLRQSILKPTIYVVDNASTDHTVERLKRDYPEVHLIENRENRGFGQANNQAAEQALLDGAHYLFLLNQDAWIDEKTLGTLMELSLQLPHFGILSPTHLNGEGNRLEKGFAHYTKLKDLEALDQSQSHHEAGFVNAAFWLIPAPVWQQLGGFSPLFYHYGEDVDFVNRLHYHGYAIAYSPQVFGCHDREYRPVTHTAYLRSEWVYLLSEYANLNHSLPAAMAYSVLAAVKKSLIALGHGKTSDSLAFMKMALKLTAMSMQIINTRNHYRHA